MSVNTSSKYRQKTKNLATPNGNPEYLFWFDEWSKMRDCILGQKQIRAMQTAYLPRYAKMTDDEYSAYLQRAPYYNMTSRTLDGMIGTAFLRNPKVTGLPKPLTKNLRTVSVKGSSFLVYSKQVCEEIIKIGRVGVLCDMSQDGGRPYLSTYLAENIIDWETQVIDGSETLVRVVLREINRKKDEIGAYAVTYRVLSIESGVYTQSTYPVDSLDSEVDFASAVPTEVLTPTNRGAALTEIPFVFFGPKSNETEVEKPPLLDIADLNLSHYQSYAQLEQGRWYTGLPIYYAEIGAGGEMAEYEIAPNVVWQLTPGAKAGIIEFNGQGLKFLENSLKDKENQISSLGGRMVNNRPDSTGKSTEETKMNDRNERSLLVSVTSALDEGFTRLMKWWAAWQDVKEVDDIEVRFNKDFMLDAMGAREFRAIILMYQEGILPIAALHEVFQRLNIIPDTMDLEDFKIALDDPEQFPNNPDIIAMKAGFPDAKAMHDHNEAILANKRAQEQQDKDNASSSNTGTETE